MKAREYLERTSQLVHIVNRYGQKLQPLTDEAEAVRTANLTMPRTKRNTNRAEEYIDTKIEVEKAMDYVTTFAVWATCQGSK